MSRGESRLAAVTVDRDVPGDPRYPYLAKLLGLANGYEALGRMIVLWSTCTALQTDRPPPAKIEACFESDRAVDALIAADLAERDDQGVRVKGGNGRLDWFAELGDKRSTAGKTRAARATRDERGRLTSKSPARPAHAGDVLESNVRDLTIESSKPPAHAGCAGPASPASESGSGSESRRARVSDPVGPVSASPDPGQGGGADRAQRPRPPGLGDVDADPEVLARRALGTEVWQHLNRRRIVVARELELEPPRHLHDMLPGRVALADRLRESGPRAREDAYHVLAVAEAEARASRSLRWFGGSIFEPKAWAVKLGMSTTDARASPTERNVFDIVDQTTAAIIAARERGEEPDA